MHKHIHRLIIFAPFAFFMVSMGLLIIYSSNPDTHLPVKHSEQILEVNQHSEAVTEAEISSELTSLNLPFASEENQNLSDFTFVALYGTPEYRGLGALGEQSLDEAVTRAKTQAELYAAYSDQAVIPTFEIITTVASATATDNDDYSQELDKEKLRPWVDRAYDEKFYVLLDIQPGRSSFLEQAMRYEELLTQPHVGLALDPEWRLQTESDRHLIKVGSVSAAEVNATSEWLADLVKNHQLPQKIFMIHQFKPSMIQDRETLVTSREELSYIIHVDGFGTLAQKTETWNRTKEGLPENISLGWKNFYDEDKPTPTPAQTMLQIPKPHFISYQ